MKKVILWSLLAFLSFVIYGCGSGDFSSATTVVTGAASKGPITGGTVKIFEITTSAHQGKLLYTTQPQSGSFSASLGSYKGAIFATMSGGTYTSEATGTSGVPLTQKLHAATFISKSGPVNLAITPLSELAFRGMSSLTQARIENANARVTSFYLKGLSAGKDVTNTLPADVLKNSTETTTDPDRINYGLALATISQMMTSASLESVITTLSNALATSDTTAYMTAFTNLPTANLQTGVKTTPLAVTLAPTNPSKAGGIAGTGDVGLTATVTGFGGTAIADGTVVTFAVTSGSGSFSTSTTVTTTTATTSGGTALVNLSSNTIGKAVVTATAEAATSNLSVPFAQNPNDPVTVNLTAPLGGTAKANGTSTITLTATVLAVSGSPVPDGTTVTFAITSGSGSFSTSSTTTTTTATTSSGNASVALSSSTIGSVTVTATAKTALGAAVNGTTTVSFIQDPNAAASVAVSPSSPTTSFVGSSVTITATVTTFAGGAIADGTTVAFTTSNSNGTLSSPTATTSGGSASVTLIGAAVGSVTVTATTGGKSHTTAAVTFKAAPTTATVKISTGGVASGTLIGDLKALLSYPSGKYTIVSVVPSGSGSSLVPGTNFVPNIATNPIQIGLFTSAGISSGEFATATFNITSGTSPATTDFSAASGATAHDVNNNVLTGITFSTGVTFQ